MANTILSLVTHVKGILAVYKNLRDCKASPKQAPRLRSDDVVSFVCGYV